jgi:hypothetical protein
LDEASWDIVHAQVDADELASLGDAWRAWAAAPDGWFAVIHGEVICFGR